MATKFTLSSRDRPTKEGTVNNTQITWLIDSGATISIMATGLFDTINDNENLVRLPVSTSLSVSGVAGGDMTIRECVQLPIEMDGITMYRPVLIVSGIEDNLAILGWDTICEENFVIDGKSGRAQIDGAPERRNKWNTAALVTGQRVKLWPRSVHKLLAIALIPGERTLQDGEEGLCEPLKNSAVSFWDCISCTDNKGKVFLTVVNTGSDAITLQPGEQLGVMRNPKVTGEEFEPLTDHKVNSIFAQMGQEPKEPERGRVMPLSSTDATSLRSRFHIRCPTEHRPRVEKLLLDYHDVCSKSKTDLGRATILKHSIRLTDDVPVHSRQFRIPVHHEKYIHEYVDELLKQGAIEVSTSPYNSPIFLVSKKIPPEWPADAPPPMRVVLDFRRVNAKSLPDRYVIRETREYIDAIGANKSKFFSACDLTSSFWQQELEEASRQYTAFTVPGRGTRYMFSVSAMGLQGSPSSFAKLMDHVMRGVQDQLTFIDDMLVHSPTIDRHMVALENVLLRLRKYNLKLNIDKSIFAAEEVQYLGFTVSGTGVSPSTDKLEAIRDAKPPTTPRQVRQWVGVCNYFRWMLPSFSKYSSILTALTKKESKWMNQPLPEQARRAFEDLKAALCSPPVVVYPDKDKEFILHTDGALGDKATGVPGGLGAALTQLDDQGRERAIAYGSRALKDHEKNYSAYLVEMAAAVFGIEHFSVYLRGRKFIHYCDHRPLESLSSTHTRTLNRFQQLMTEYQFETRYRPGEENVLADLLSRNSVAAFALTDDSGSVIEAQRQDKSIDDIKSFIRTKRLPKGDAKYAQWVRRIAEKCEVHDDLVWHKRTRPGFREKHLLLAPKPHRHMIIQSAHCDISAGHGGVDRTANRVMQHYWWPGLESEVKRYVASCEICQTSRAEKEPPARLQSLPVCTMPNMRVHIDLFGDLRTSHSGKKWIMVMTDAFTKYVELEAIENKSAETCARVFFERWLCRHTAPLYVCSDRGKEWINHVMDLVCELWGVTRLRTSAFHPATNSSAEVYNKSLIKYMRAMLDKDKTTDWESWLAPAALAFNCHVHKSTRESPFFLTFLHDPNLPFCDFDQPRKLYGENYAHEAYNLAQAAHFRIKENLQEAQKRQEDYFNRSAKDRSYVKGQRVLCHFPNVPVGVNQKFFRKWRLFTVVRMVGPVNVELREKPKSRSITVHINRTRLACPAETASTAVDDGGGEEGADAADLTEKQLLPEATAAQPGGQQQSHEGIGDTSLPGPGCTDWPGSPEDHKKQALKDADDGGVPQSPQAEQGAPTVREQRGDGEQLKHPSTVKRRGKKMEASTRYNLRPRPHRVSLGSRQLAAGSHPVDIVNSTVSQVFSINNVKQIADTSEESEGEDDWVYVLGAPIRRRTPGLSNPVEGSPSTRQVLSPGLGETGSAAVPSLGVVSSDDTLSGRSSPLSSSEADLFATAKERVNLEDFATAQSVLDLPQDTLQAEGDSEGSDIELEPSSTTAFADLIALTSDSGCRTTGTAGAGFTQPGTAGAGSTQPAAWDLVAHSLLPRVTPITGITGHHTRSHGPVRDIPLPSVCPTRRRRQGQGQQGQEEGT